MNQQQLDYLHSIDNGSKSMSKLWKRIYNKDVNRVVIDLMKIKWDNSYQSLTPQANSGFPLLKNLFVMALYEGVYVFYFKNRRLHGRKLNIE